MPWRVEFFRTARGTSPASEFIEGLPRKAASKVVRDLELLEEYGTRLGQPYVAPLVGVAGMFELRTSFGSDDFRMFFFRAGERFIVVHGIRKKTQRTPARDIEMAERRRAVWLGR